MAPTRSAGAGTTAHDQAAAREVVLDQIRQDDVGDAAAIGMAAGFGPRPS